MKFWIMKLTKIELIFVVVLILISGITIWLLLVGTFFLRQNNFIISQNSYATNNLINFSVNNDRFILRMLFGGDIMMGRGLDKYFKIYGYEYPFIKVKRLFSQIKWDIIYANLEGPIIDNAKPIQPLSFTFGFVPQISNALKNVGFNLINIANNHITNYGYNGVMTTRRYLTDNNIDVLGDNYECNLKYSIQKYNIIFFGVNLVPLNNQCLNELITTIKELKNKNSNLFIIVTPHWGIEYQQTPSLFQKEIAHRLIDSGVDLIIGHHPHVIQSIEEYNNKLIFYSLGNLVFDQYFSSLTQQSLIIGLEYNPQKQVYYLLPLKSNLGQLNFMKNEEEQELLEHLSQISTSKLQQMIRNGVITVNNF